MPTDFFFTYHPFKPELVKQASDGGSPPIDASARRECDELMQRIYAENPSFWPYGVGTHMLDGGAYIIRNSHTKKAMGFAGWQERPEGVKRVGYYAIGVLPEFRGMGLAKRAVARLIQDKSASVDEVRAFIVPGNKPSIALAESLGIPVQHKSAAIKNLLGGLATAGVLDGIAFGGDYKNFDTQRGLNAAFNTLLGFGGTHMLRKGLGPHAGPYDIGGGATMIGAAPVKDLAIAGQKTLHKANDMFDASTAKLRAPDVAPGVTGKDIATAGGLALGGGALGYAIYRGLKKLRQPQDTGRVRIKLPRPDGTFTEVELPMEQLVDLPDSVTDALGRDVKRQMRTESRLRTFRRGKDHKLRPVVYDDDEIVQKAAAFVPPAGANGAKMLPPLGFQNNAQSIRQKHEQAQATLDQQVQMQQQQQAELAAKAPPPAPAVEARPPISSGIQYATNRTLKTIGSLKRADANDPFSPAAPKAAPTSPSIGAPTATSPSPSQAGAPQAAAPAPAAVSENSARVDPYAEHRARMQARGLTVKDTSNGIVGVDAKGNRYNVDSAGRYSQYQVPSAPAQPSSDNDPWYHKYNPISRMAYSAMGGDQADYGALQDWMGGRPGATVLGDYEGYNPLKVVGRTAENVLRGYARGNDAAAQGLDAVRSGNYGEALDQAGRFATEYGANSLQIGGNLALGGLGGNLLKGTGQLAARKAVPTVASRFGLSAPTTWAGRIGQGVINHGTSNLVGSGAIAAGGALDQLNDEHTDPYRISGSSDPRLAAALGQQEMSNRASVPGSNFNSQFDLSMANQGMAPWAYNLPQVSPYAQDRMSLANRLSQNPVGGLAAGWLMPKMFGNVDQQDLTSPTF